MYSANCRYDTPLAPHHFSDHFPAMQLTFRQNESGSGARNALCSCNSGKRFKHCCGAVSSTLPSAATHNRDRLAALNLQRQQQFVSAIAAYDAILEVNGGDWEVAHMRAVSLYQLGLLDDARPAFLSLLATPAVKFQNFWNNLGLLVAGLCSNEWAPHLQDKIAAYRLAHSSCPVTAADSSPPISVVLPTYQHRAYVAEAIGSVFSQTVPPLELIVIDDGSSDGTVEICRTLLNNAPFPVKFIARENRGAAATLNQGIEMASGDFIQLLNSDDRLPPARIGLMGAALAARNADWGYSRISYLNAGSSVLKRPDDPRVAALTSAQDAAFMSHTLGLAMLRANSAISSGNLMFRKSLWHTLGGFRNYRYNHDWDFCLRASLHSEPIMLPQTLYEYRIHASNTIAEDSVAPRAEHARVMADFMAETATRQEWPNRFAPTLTNWGDIGLALLGATANMASVPLPILEDVLRRPYAPSFDRIGT